MSNDISTKQAGLSQSGGTSQMTVLCADDTAKVGGAMAWALVGEFFVLGCCIGYGIDQAFIKPLWNN